jgi:hypothetical protein
VACPSFLQLKAEHAKLAQEACSRSWVETTAAQDGVEA